MQRETSLPCYSWFFILTQGEDGRDGFGNEGPKGRKVHDPFILTNNVICIFNFA